MAKKKEENIESYDWIKDLKEYPCSNMLKAGIKYYIQSKKISVKDNKDLEKIIKEYKEIKI